MTEPRERVTRAVQDALGSSDMTLADVVRLADLLDAEGLVMRSTLAPDGRLEVRVSRRVGPDQPVILEE